ncbi:MAG: NAD(P)H-hydrate dehydratase [Candidatus Brocadiaceae bacterium]|nr:NAD(P)H-hydrate dehydratase [Candidatus Brocadiaceae bacterium]
MAEDVYRLPRMPGRRPDAHKGQFGRVLIVAGSPGMTGAGCMAAIAAQRAGAGLVTLALPAALNFIAEVKLTSAMSRPLPDPDGPILGPDAARSILQGAEAFDVAAIGPGVGRAGPTGQAMRTLAASLALPAVVDADALNALAEGPGRVLRHAPAARLLTPHPGEMARLLGCATAEVQADRRAAAVGFAREHSVLVALKGAGTVVTDGARVYVNPTGNPGMATGGSGDVLTGMAAGLLAQGIEPFEALQVAVFVHGLAGDLAARRLGELSLMAEDLLECLPQAFCLYREHGQGMDADAAASAAMAPGQ